MKMGDLNEDMQRNSDIQKLKQRRAQWWVGGWPYPFSEGEIDDPEPEVRLLLSLEVFQLQ